MLKCSPSLVAGELQALKTRVLDCQQGSGLFVSVLVKLDDMPKVLAEDVVQPERLYAQVGLVAALALVSEEVLMNRGASQAEAFFC